MPFKSEAQRRYLYANEPKVAKEYASKTSKNAKLPEYVKRKKKSALLEAYENGGKRLNRK